MKVAIYCRLSEEDRHKQQEDSNSIQNQKAMLVQYAAEQGWEIHDIYSDDDYAGADRNRPAFSRLLTDAKKRKFQIVLCKTQSRFTRELELVEKYIHGLFPLWGIRFVSVVDHADTANKGNKKSRQINGLVNEWYLEDLSENIKSVLTSRRQNGHHIGAFALYGYKKDPDQKGHLLIDDKAAAIVREVFMRFAQGYGKTAIARLLNDRGVPNPTEYKRQNGLRYCRSERKNSTLWRYAAIAALLKNEMYIGHMVQGKYGSISYKTKQNKPRTKDSWYRVENTHQPIIDRALWDSVQARIAQNAKPFAAGQVGIFAGRVRCAGCGYVMRSSKTRDRYYLKCASRYAAKDACEGAFIAVQKLEQIVMEQLSALVEGCLDWEMLEEHAVLQNEVQMQERRLQDALRQHQAQADACAKYLREIYVDKVKGILSEEEFMQLSGAFSADQARAADLVGEMQLQLDALAEQKTAQCSPRERMEQYTKKLTHALAATMIDRILVGKRISGTRNIPIEIHWNF